MCLMNMCSQFGCLNLFHQLRRLCVVSKGFKVLISMFGSGFSQFSPVTLAFKMLCAMLPCILGEFFEFRVEVRLSWTSPSFCIIRDDRLIRMSDPSQIKSNKGKATAVRRNKC